MPVSRFGRVASTAAATTLLALAGGAAAEGRSHEDATRAGDRAPYKTSPFSGNRGAQSRAPGGQTGTTADHLPPRAENMELVGERELTGAFGDVIPGQFADLAVFKDFAYVNSWGVEAEGEEDCRGGFSVVDISAPADPREVTFVRALPGNYHGEGAHAITVNTDAFSGDVLAVNNERCRDVEVGGGFDLYDVSDPANPVPLALGVGDRSSENEDGVPVMVNPEQAGANDYHSVFMWQHNGRAYLAGVDNFDFYDVDIFDITNPRAPTPVGEFWLLDRYFDEIYDGGALNSEFAPTVDIFNHDMTVKTIDGVPTMLVSNWDAGYVKLDVSNPADPQLLGDTTFEGPDPLVGLDPPEGNAHYAEFSYDNRFILAADEDFAPARITTIGVDGVGEFPGSAVSGGAPIALTDDGLLNGPAVYGGYGCPDPDGAGPASGSAPVPDRDDYALALEPGEEAILVLQRGPVDDPEALEEPCFPGEKANEAQEAGWDAVLLVNHHAGGDVPYCGSGGYPSGVLVVTACAGHNVLHELFETPEAEYGPAHEPDVGDEAPNKVTIDDVFDGWGYAHAYRNGGDDMPAVGHYAIPEALDPRYQVGFGDLSIHEFATDPTEYLAYAAYYSGGMRTFRFGEGGLDETGVYIDEDGSNFWGVEQFTTGSGERLIAGSDRDFGIQLFRYTGPGAAQPPECDDQTYGTEENTPETITLVCRDINNNPLTLSIASPPANGTLSAINGDRVTYTPRRGFSGTDTFTYVASDGVATSRPATITILVGRCSNRITGTETRDVLNGTAAGDGIAARGGNDEVEALQGDDCAAGEAGNDQLTGGPGADVLGGGPGRDRLFGGPGNDALRGNDTRDHLNGSSGNDRLRGDAGDDFLGGGSNNDVVIGGAGVDSVRGEAGNDRLNGGGGNDRINTGKGRNRVNAGAGNDRVTAVNGSRDSISCGRGRDRVRADRKDRVGRSCEVVRRTRLTRR